MSITGSRLRHLRVLSFQGIISALVALVTYPLTTFVSCFSIPVVVHSSKSFVATEYFSCFQAIYLLSTIAVYKPLRS